MPPRPKGFHRAETPRREGPESFFSAPQPLCASLFPALIFVRGLHPSRQIGQPLTTPSAFICVHSRFSLPNVNDVVPYSPGLCGSPHYRGSRPHRVPYPARGCLCLWPLPGVAPRRRNPGLYGRIPLGFPEGDGARHDLGDSRRESRKGPTSCTFSNTRHHS